MWLFQPKSQKNQQSRAKRSESLPERNGIGQTMELPTSSKLIPAMGFVVISSRTVGASRFPTEGSALPVTTVPVVSQVTRFPAVAETAESDKLSCLPRTLFKELHPHNPTHRQHRCDRHHRHKRYQRHNRHNRTSPMIELKPHCNQALCRKHAVV